MIVGGMGSNRMLTFGMGRRRLAAAWYRVREVVAAVLVTLHLRSDAGG